MWWYQSDYNDWTLSWNGRGSETLCSFPSSYTPLWYPWFGQAFGGLDSITSFSQQLQIGNHRHRAETCIWLSVIPYPTFVRFAKLFLTCRILWHSLAVHQSLLIFQGKRHSIMRSNHCQTYMYCYMIYQEMNHQSIIIEFHGEIRLSQPFFGSLNH